MPEPVQMPYIDHLEIEKQARQLRADAVARSARALWSRLRGLSAGRPVPAGRVA